MLFDNCISRPQGGLGRGTTSRTGGSRVPCFLLLGSTSFLSSGAMKVCLMLPCFGRVRDVRVSLLTACLWLQPHQLGWLASISVPGHGKHLWCAGLCVRARLAGAASAPGIVRVSTSPDIVRLRNVYRSSWGREKQKPPPKGRDMRQRWAWITHRQPDGPCYGLWASARLAPAAQLGRPQRAQYCTDPARS